MVSRSALPIATVLAAIVALWYVGAVFLNAPWERDQAEARRGLGLQAHLHLRHEDLLLHLQVDDTGDVFDEHMAFRHQTHQHLVHHGSFSLDDSLDVRRDCLEPIGKPGDSIIVCVWHVRTLPVGTRTLQVVGTNLPSNLSW